MSGRTNCNVIDTPSRDARYSVCRGRAECVPQEGSIRAAREARESKQGAASLTFVQMLQDGGRGSSVMSVDGRSELVRDTPVTIDVAQSDCQPERNPPSSGAAERAEPHRRRRREGHLRGGIAKLLYIERFDGL